MSDIATDRELIRRALWAFPPTSPAGVAINALAAALERHLASKMPARTSDSAALRAEIDDHLTQVMLVWADAIEDEGRSQTAEGVRWLARQGKRPGSYLGKFRWAVERSEWGSGGSWVLPAPLANAIVSDSGDLRGRFPSLSAALLASAKLVPPYLRWAAQQQEPPSEADNQEATIEESKGGTLFGN